jgi:tetratricopeptide (TPR) repeat protein
LPELEISILDSYSSSEEDEGCDNESHHSQDHEEENNPNDIEDVDEGEGNSGYNQAIKCMEEAVKVQELKLGKHHAAVSRTLHGLALEHRNKGQYNLALSCLQKALTLVEERIDMVNHSEENYGDEESQTMRLLEEKSVLYACQASVYRRRNMFTQSMDSYVNSVDTLVEAGYDGTSRRICMLMRIMKRAAFQQREGDDSR